MATSEFLVWGNNQSSLLSKEAGNCIPAPTHLSISYQIVSLCASEKHVSFLTKDGSVFSYGINLDGRLGVSTRAVDKVSYDAPVKVPIKDRVIRIQSGFSHMCALTERGELLAWGLGDYGALGTGQFKSRSVPTKVKLDKEALENLRQISCGAMHTAFLTELGEVFTCGSNEYGQLGLNKPEKVSTPIAISFHQPVQQVSCGVFYTLLLTREGRVYGMGNNKYGQLGIGHKVNECHPTMIRDLEGIVKVSAGYHSGAIDCYGNLYVWGSGSFGELIRPQKYVLSVPIRDIAIRGFFGLAIGHTSKDENRVYTWGNNTFGQLGTGSYDAAKQPVEVDDLRGMQIGKIVLGINFAMVLLIGRPETNRFPPQDFVRFAEDRNREFEYYPRQTQRKSVKDFEEGYLNSHLRSQNQRERASYTIRSPPRQRDVSQSRSQTRREITTVDYNRETARDYQRLFTNLSQDYERLVGKYKALQKQLEILNSQAIQSNRREDTYRRDDLYARGEPTEGEQKARIQNNSLKNEISRVNVELASLKEQLRLKNNLVEEQKIQLIRAKANSSSERSPSFPQEIENQYNKLLNQKEQLINKLTTALHKGQNESSLLLAKLENQKTELAIMLEMEQQKIPKIVQEHQAIINQLQQELARGGKTTKSLQEENDRLKKKFLEMEDSWRELQSFRSRMEEESATERVMRDKYERELKEDLINKGILANKTEELEIELSYEREFNKRYEGAVAEVNDQKEKLHEQLNLQLKINQEQGHTIQQLRQEVEKYRKYRKQVDEKNIQIEEQKQVFEDYQKRINSIVSEKDQKIKHISLELEERAKQFELKLQQKESLIETISKDVNRLEKDIVKQKDTISILKQDSALKEEENEHLTQQKNAMEKKLAYLNTELSKEVKQREELGSELGEAKREIVKIKINNGELENKYTLQRDEREKISRALGIKEAEAEQIKEDLQKEQKKCDNLKKENNMLRIQVEDVNFRIEEQQKINDELIKANKDFAISEQEFTETIRELNEKLYEIEDENKSFNQKYDALMQRNKELDARNRQLADMVNKAIQIQAENYKTNILKQVQCNTDRFLSQVKEQQEFRSKGRRRAQEQPFRHEKSEEQFKSPPVSVIKDEPYTREMKQRISNHKRKVSESANKLASLLDLQDVRGDRRALGIDSRRTDDLQKINFQMESFSNQKQEFMSKIQSFAEKLKIL